MYEQQQPSRFQRLSYRCRRLHRRGVSFGRPATLEISQIQKARKISAFLLTLPAPQGQVLPLDVLPDFSESCYHEGAGTYYNCRETPTQRSGFERDC